MALEVSGQRSVSLLIVQELYGRCVQKYIQLWKLGRRQGSWYSRETYEIRRRMKAGLGVGVA